MLLNNKKVPFSLRFPFLFLFFFSKLLDTAPANVVTTTATATVDSVIQRIYACIENRPSSSSLRRRCRCCHWHTQANASKTSITHSANELNNSTNSSSNQWIICAETQWRQWYLAEIVGSRPPCLNFWYVFPSVYSYVLSSFNTCMRKER